jgi:hypothetical protein
MSDSSSSQGKLFARSATALGIASRRGVQQRQFRERRRKAVEVERCRSAVHHGATLAVFITALSDLHVCPSKGAHDAQVLNALGPIAGHFGDATSAVNKVDNFAKAEAAFITWLHGRTVRAVLGNNGAESVADARALSASAAGIILLGFRRARKPSTSLLQG